MLTRHRHYQLPCSVCRFASLRNRDWIDTRIGEASLRWQSVSALYALSLIAFVAVTDDSCNSYNLHSSHEHERIGCLFGERISRYCAQLYRSLLAILRIYTTRASFEFISGLARGHQYFLRVPARLSRSIIESSDRYLSPSTVSLVPASMHSFILLRLSRVKSELSHELPFFTTLHSQNRPPLSSPLSPLSTSPIYLMHRL